MENNAPTPGWGPRRGAGLRPLSVSRAAILDMLRDQPEPVTQAAVVRLTGLHENTVREHLAGLVQRGLVRRSPAVPTGRGRPAWLYELTDAGAGSEYAGLVAVLADTIAKTAPDPLASALEAGEQWGRGLAAGRAEGDGPVDGGQARSAVVAMMDDLGYEPQVSPADPAEVRLTRCPLLEAAYRHEEVVCAVHLGIVRGALAGLGAPTEGTGLVPFAEPGACLLTVPPRSR